MNKSVSIYDQLGKRIVFLRKQKGISQLDLALIAEINKNYLSDMERGRRNPTLMILNRIAIALEITMSDLLQGVQDFSLEDIVSKITSIK